MLKYNAYIFNIPFNVKRTAATEFYFLVKFRRSYFFEYFIKLRHVNRYANVFKHTMNIYLLAITMNSFTLKH